MAKFGRIEIIRDLHNLVKELATGLRQLTFADNFQSFQVVTDLAAGEEKATIRNQLKAVPNSYIIEYQTGNGLVTAGNTPWNKNYISFKNHGSVAVSVRIRVLKD